MLRYRSPSFASFSIRCSAILSKVCEMQLSVRVRLMLWIKMTSRPTWVKPMSRYVHLRTFLIDGLPTIYRNVGA